MVRTTLFLDPTLWRSLRVRALEEGTTATALLQQAIALYLKTSKKKETKG
jgi:hypothetical protein